jgi:hypothetical protein
VATSGPGITDIKLLFARSGNRCAFPKRTSPIAQGDTPIAQKPGWPRYDATRTPGFF